MTAKRKAAPKYVWVARDAVFNEMSANSYDIYLVKPEFSESNRWFTESATDSRIINGMCPEMFERMTGIVLQPGTCRRFLWRSPLAAPKATKRKKVKA